MRCGLISLSIENQHAQLKYYQLIHDHTIDSLFAQSYRLRVFAKELD